MVVPSSSPTRDSGGGEGRSSFGALLHTLIECSGPITQVRAFFMSIFSYYCDFDKFYSHDLAKDILFGIVLLIMKAEIHPQYFSDVKVTCACGNTFTVGSTKEHIEVEICSACHPFYTGNDKVLDTAGRVEKFKTRRANATKPKTKTKTKK